MLMSGCSDSDYDLSSVDAKLGVGSNLSLPSDNSVNIMLDDILDLGSTDLIKVLGNGDYQFGKDPETVSDVNVNVDKITLSDKTEAGLYFDINLPTFPSEIIGEEVNLPYTDVTPPIDIEAQSGDVSLLDYEFDATAEIKSLKWVRVGNGGAGVDLNLSLTFPDDIKKFQYVTIEMPKMLEMTCNKSGFNASTNTLTLNNCTPSECSSIVFNVTRINIKDVDAQNYAKLENGKFKLHSNVRLTIKVSKVKVSSKTSVQIGGNASFNNLVITAGNGQFKPTIDPQNVGSTTINSLPDFLTDARVVADVDNPQIWLTLESNLPLGGYVEAKLSSTTSSKDVILSKAKGNELPIAANTTTRLVVCRKAPANLSGYTPVIASDLSDIIKTLKEGMEINIDITKFEAVQTSDITVELGHDYTLAPTYNFTAPLVLGDKAKIVYSDNEDDLNKDLKDLNLSKGAVLTVVADVNNQVPAYLEINITPLGVNGQPISTLVVKPIQNKVAAAGTIKYEISDPNGTGLNQLDGIEYELLVTAPTTSSEKGKVLNKNQKIVIKTTDLHLDGQVIIDAN
jgi:hypothetical protein